MNTARFLFCINSDDPDIVTQGLDEFRDQVLLDHGATTNYGYHGRGSSDSVMEALHPDSVSVTTGTLSSFIRSSPQLEELFILWGLPGRDDDKPLSSAHMSCMAVILHAATSNSTFCSTVVNRILHEHSKSIISQLSSGNLKLVHSTLALVLAMCRSSPQNCRDTFQKLVAISLPTFSTLLQQGKTITWEAEKKTESTQTVKLKTDSRLLLIIIIFTAVEASDHSSGPELYTSSTSLLKRITNSLTKDTLFVIELILKGLMYIRKQPVCEQFIGSKLVDLRFQDNLLYLYHNEDIKVQRVVHSFLVDHSYHLVTSMGKGGRGIASGNAKASALQLLRNLEGHRDLRHREIQMVLLKAQPSLIAKSIGSVVLPNWEPHPTVQYYCALSQLTFLCTSVEVDSQFKTAMKAVMISVSADGVSQKDRVKAEGSVRGLMSTFVQSMIPTGFQKKDISKLLQHKNCLLQRSGLLYVLSVMQRLMKSTTAAAAAGAGRVVKIEAAVASVVHKLLPDFQLLLNLRSRYSKVVAEGSYATPETSRSNAEDMEVEGQSTEEQKGERAKILYLLSLLLRIIEFYIKTVPSLVAQAGFELTRLIDEVVPWSGKDTAQSAMTALTVHLDTITVMLGPVIRALRHATSSRHCKWFGSSEDCVKLITQLIVSQEWNKVVKRSPLAKLLLLASCKALELADSELHSSIKQLVRTVLKQSGLFQGHGEVDLELRTEQAAWLEAMTETDKSVLLLDSTLRIAYHWNTECCIEVSERISKHTKGLGYQLGQLGVSSSGEADGVMSPISPVLSCAINLCANNFTILAAHLPKHIRVHVDPSKPETCVESEEAVGTPSSAVDSSTFLQKYSSGFRSELQGLLLDVVMTSGVKARSPESYGRCVLAAADAESAAVGDVTLLRDISNINALLSLSTATRTAVPVKTAKASGTPVKGKAKHPADLTAQLIEGIAGLGSVSSDLLQRVLDRTFSAANSSASEASKRLKTESESATGDERMGVQGDTVRMRLDSSIVVFIVRNIDKVVGCYDVLLLKKTQTDDEEAGVLLQCIDAVGLFSAYLCCSQGVAGQGQSASFYHWVSVLAMRELARSRTAAHSELEQKAATVVQSIRLLQIICQSYDPTAAPSIGGKGKKPIDECAETGPKRKTRSASVDEGSADTNSAILDAAAAITSLIVEIVRQTSCAPLVADALHSAQILDGMAHMSLFGKLSRQVLCAAASAYFKRSNSRAKKGSEGPGLQGVEHTTLSLWTEVAERLLVMRAAQQSSVPSRAKVHSVCDLSVQSAERDSFSLGWMVQHFVANPLLRSQFVDMALKDGQGHSLLDLSLKVSVAPVCSSFALIPLDAVCLSVLQSASVQTLASALSSFVQQDASMPDSADDEAQVHTEGSVKAAASNALCCAAVGFGPSTSSSLPCVTSFISPLNLLRVLSYDIDDVSSKMHHLAPLCPTLLAHTHSHSQRAFYTLALPVCLGREDVSLWDAVKILREGDYGSDSTHIVGSDGNQSNRSISDSDRLTYLQGLEATELSKGPVKSISAACQMLSHPSLIGSSYTVCLLASYAQSQLAPSARSTFVKGPFTAIALCCSLSDVLSGSSSMETELAALWCQAYISFICDLLDDFTAYLAAQDTAAASLPEQSQRIAAYFSLLQPMLMISMKSTTIRQSTVNIILEKLSAKSSEVRKKMNKWIKSCLKFGIHINAVVSGLTSFYCAGRSSFLASVGTDSVPVRAGVLSLWGNILCPKTADFYHPSLVLQMVVSHSKFTVTLRGAKQLQPNSPLLRLLLSLLSVSLPVSDCFETSEELVEKNNAGTGADQFLVAALMQMYQGTVCDTDRMILRILYILNSADKCPALCTLKPITLNSKKSIRNLNEPATPLIGTILQQLVYSTISQYPTWRAFAPQPMDLEGPEAERTYRHTFSSVARSVTSDWGDVTMDVDDVEKKGGKLTGAERKGTDYGSSSEESGSESDSDSDEEGEGKHSETDSVLSIMSVKESSAADWNCDDSDAYVPSVDALGQCTDKVYDPCFWLPALHHSLMQHPLSVRQLANTGALSLVIAGISSRCPVLRALAFSSLQKIFELAKQQTPDKDSGFRERPQLILLLNFIRNALDSFAPSSSGPTQFPSVISLFLSRAALHLLQPTHELFSKINKYLLSRPFCDFKDVPLYDILLVDGDATTEQASRLTTFRIVRDGLSTRWDHLNLCRKNAYNRLMLLFPVLSKDVRAGHAVFDLLDKALGMQVSSRYLLERCSVISWLQQMASPTNSLDIDTTRSSSSATHINADDAQDRIDLTSEEIGDEAESKFRGARNVVTRSQPSVLLAAPPRLLARVLCLMRRALGASYLLSAGSSSSSSLHLDQIHLAVTTLIDDVIAVDRVGMATEIPLEFFRQLVLLLWDFAHCWSGGEGLQWGVDRVRLLALAIQHSSRASGGHAVDDLVVSLLSLLAFQTSSPLQGPGAKNSRYEEVSELILGCALKHLILPQGGKREETYAIAQATSSSASSASDSSDAVSYYSVVNILSQDNLKGKVQREVEETWTLNMRDGPSGSWKPAEETAEYPNLSLLLHESWELLAHTGFEAMSLPVSLGKKVMLCMNAKALLSVAVMSCRDDDLSFRSWGPEGTAETGPLFPPGVARWALTMTSAFLRPAVTALSVAPSLSMAQNHAHMKRVLSCSDASSFNSYSMQFCDFQLTFRLAILAVGSVADRLAAEGREIGDALRTILHYLLRFPISSGANSVTSIFQSLSRSKPRGSDAMSALDSSYFWEHSTSTRKRTLEICSLSLELCGAVVSCLDRHTALGVCAAIQRDSSPVDASSIEGSTAVCGRSMHADAANLISLCTTQSEVLSPSGLTAAHTDTAAAPMLSFHECFEPMPGKDKNPSIGPKRSTVLFDRSSALWRQGCVGSRDRVLASMRAVQIAPLSGIESHMQVEEDGADGDDIGIGEDNDQDMELDSENETDDDEDDVLVNLGVSNAVTAEDEVDPDVGDSENERGNDAEEEEEEENEIDCD